MNRLKSWTSFSNLTKARPLGQVATLLILVITAVLIFMLAVANIGQVSTYATNLSIAADGASLYYASQIATKSTQLSEQLINSCGDPLKCCAKTGLLSIILAVLLAIVALVLCVVYGVGLIFIPFICALAGAAGGAIGGAIAGTGAAQGAIQGAVVGFAIGLAYVAAIAAGPLGLYGSSAIIGSVATGLGGTVAVSVAAVVAAVIGVTLAIASNIYTAYAKDAMTGDAMAAAAKALSGLPETQRIRESVFLKALSETIDDPNKVPDVNDSDGDGDSTELVPSFQYCWDRRVSDLKAGNAAFGSQAEQAVRAFLTNPDSTVNNFLLNVDTFLAAVRRLEVEGNDGTVTLLFRALDDYALATGENRFDVRFWEAGPTLAELTNWANQCSACSDPDCPDCAVPATYDELDYDIDELIDFSTGASGYRNQTTDNLVYNWRQWVPWFYGDEYSAYNYLGNLINGDNSSNPARFGLRNWIIEINTIEGRLPDCIYPLDAYGNPSSCCGGSGSTDAYGNPVSNPGVDGYGNPTGTGCAIENPPCKWNPVIPNFGTINPDCNDEFEAARNAINTFIQQVEAFRQAALAFYNLMESLESAGMITVTGCGLSGINPIMYEWGDSRGAHSITVQLGDYQLPRIVNKKYGNWLVGKKCIELINWRQNLNVRITRQDPTRINMGVLGRWNPTNGRVRRSSTAGFQGLWGNFGWVRIAN